MLEQATAQEYIRPSRNGRTRPIMLACADAAGNEVELYTKISRRCDEGAVNLVREAIAACLAADLGLPIMQPFLVDLPPAWVASVPDAGLRTDIAASAPVAFGSRIAGPQFAIWQPGMILRPEMIPAALAIFTFDAIIQNVDRLVKNPNCLVLGPNLRIIDHELAFAHRLILGWRPPWTAGAMQSLAVPPSIHTFYTGLRKQSLDFTPIRAAWSALSDGRIDAYAAALPLAWGGAGCQAAVDAISLIKDARDHIEGCLAEVHRVLT